tara:strand:- start:886 stop:1656 length:771 start_codon:yes stop_codon:yes gene_type:complete
MKIATWNINGFRAREEYLLRWLADKQPDVVGLQELKLIDDGFPHEPFNALGYEVITHGQKAWNGVAVLSRLPIDVQQIGLADQVELGARFLNVRIDNLFDFITVYCPNGKALDHPDFQRKLGWFDSLRNYIETSVSDSAIICGDFNVVPAAIDGWKGVAGEGNIFQTAEERACLNGLFDQGLTDLFRYKYPSERTFSWWDYRAGSFYKDHGLRIDLILATSNLTDQLIEIQTDRDYRKKIEGMTASDHAPVIAEFT